MMPTLSEASATTVVTPQTVDPARRAVTATAGRTLSTATRTVAEMVLFPAASRATALNACELLVAVRVSHGTA